MKNSIECEKNDEPLKTKKKFIFLAKSVFEKYEEFVKI